MRAIRQSGPRSITGTEFVGNLQLRMKKYLLPLIILLGAVIRIAYLASIWNSPVLTVPIIDSGYYHTWAANLAAGVQGQQDIFFMSPLYPCFLAFIYKLTGPFPQAAAFVQVLIGILLIYLFYLLGKRLFHEDVGLLCALFAAFYRPFIYYEGVLLSATLILLLNACALLLLLRMRKAFLADILAGLLLGLSALARPNVLLFVALLAMAYLLIPSLGGRRRAGLIILGAALALLPVAYRNYQVGGKWVLTTAGAGMNFYVGNNPEADGTYREAPFLRSAEPQYEELDYRIEAAHRTGKNLDVAEASHYWLIQGLSFIQHQPLDYLRLLSRKFFLFFHRTEIPNNLSIYAALSFSGILHWIPLTFGILAPFGLAFWLLNLRNSRLLLAHVYSVSYLLATLLFFAASEYRLPVLLFLLPFAAAGINELWQCLREKRRLQAGKYLLLGFLFFLPINMPTAFTDTLMTPRMDYFNLGSVLQKQGRHQEAAAMLQRSLICDPNFAEAHRALGDSYRALGFREQAADEFLRAGLDPKKELEALDVEALFRKAQEQLNHHDSKGALQSCLEGLALSPDPPNYIYCNIAFLSLQVGDTAQALDYLKTAGESDPHEARVPYLKGIIAEGRRNWSEAVQQFTLALELKPDFDLARAHSALAYLEAGDKSAAARLIESLLGKAIEDQELADLVKQIAARAGY